MRLPRHPAIRGRPPLRQAVIRNHLCGNITLPDAPSAQVTTREDDITTLTHASRSATSPSPPGR